MNKALLIGNVTRDPEIRPTHSGKSVASWSIATNKKWKNEKGEQQERVEYHNLTAWGKLAEIVGQYVKKGMKLYVEGELRTETYEKEGVKHYTTRIVVDQMEMLTPKGTTGKRASGLPDPSEYSTPHDQEIRVEDIPFG